MYADHYIAQLSAFSTAKTMHDFKCDGSEADALFHENIYSGTSNNGHSEK